MVSFLESDWVQIFLQLGTSGVKACYQMLVLHTRAAGAATLMKHYTHIFDKDHTEFLHL